MKRLIAVGGIAGLVGLALFWVSSVPAAPPESLGDLTGDAEAGALIFAAAGCASCHVAPGAEKGEAPILAGGKAFPSDFGTFYAPNISPSAEGIGDWSDAEVIHAIQAGISPQGAYYYPAFPTHAYALADVQDIADLVAYLRTLPEAAEASRDHEVGFPFNIRRGLPLWRAAFAPDGWVIDAEGEELERGRYLVEALGHCAECHTPRNALGGLQTGRWMAGAPDPAGDGTIPALAPNHLDWSAEDIANYLDTGFTPEFDVVGGDMVEVVENTSQLSDADRLAIGAYIKALPEAD